MKVLTNSEVELVSGGGGTLREPITNAKTDKAIFINEVARAVNDFGIFLGCSIYDWTHPRATR